VHTRNRYHTLGLHAQTVVVVPVDLNAALWGTVGTGVESDCASVGSSDVYRSRAQRALRALLAAVLHVPVASISLGRRQCRLCGAPHGKPILLSPAAPLDFNLSHSGSRAVIALTRGACVGIDIELESSATHTCQIEDVFLTDQEKAAIARLAPRSQSMARLAQWVRKEAVLKATGDGLSVSPTAVSLEVGAPRAGAQRRARVGEKDLSVVDIASTGSVCAIATPAGEIRVELWPSYRPGFRLPPATGLGHSASAPNSALSRSWGSSRAQGRR
jgi:phosphopantetheinyl transferase